MPTFDSICTRCGYEETIVVVGGTHPNCARCQGPTEYVWRSYPAQIQTNEAFIGGLTIENLGHEPVTVYSRDELKAAMLRAGAEQQIHYVPGDHYLTDWSKAIDPQTLANAQFLLTHRTGPSKEKS